MAAVRRASSPSQPKTVTNAMYDNRNGMIRDHGLITELNETQVSDRVPIFGTVQGADLHDEQGV
ncbi:hypothetical protein ACWDKQ_35430 [Saccharopolyspora sp. NPDC000995]